METGKTNISVMQSLAGQLWGHIEVCGLDFKVKSLLISVSFPAMFWVQNMWTSRFNKGEPGQVSTIEEVGLCLEGPGELL